MTATLTHPTTDLAEQRERMVAEQEAKSRVGRARGKLSGTSLDEYTLSTKVSMGRLSVRVKDASWDELAASAVFGAAKVHELESKLFAANANAANERRAAEEARHVALS